MQVANGIAEGMVAMVLMLPCTHVVTAHCYQPHLSSTGQHEQERVSFLQRVWEGELHDAGVWVWGMINHGKSFYEQRWNRWKKDYVVMLWPVKKDGMLYSRNIYLFSWACLPSQEMKENQINMRENQRARGLRVLCLLGIPVNTKSRNHRKSACQPK